MQSLNENGISFHTPPSGGMHLKVAHVDWQCPKREKRGGCYEFLFPLTGPVCLKVGRIKLKIDPLEMVCVNPWQLWPLLPGGDTRCLAQLTCNAAYVDQFFLELYGHSLGGFLNRPVSIGNPLFALINRHISENRLESSGRSLTLDSIAEELLSELMHRAVEAGAAMERKKTFCPDVIDAVIDYLYEHMEESITDADLARYTNVDMGSMLRQFKQAVATTPMGYLIELRTARAKELLIQSDVGISKIARMCGFVSPVNFTVTFKRKIGLSPSEFRQKAQLPPGSCSTQDR